MGVLALVALPLGGYHLGHQTGRKAILVPACAMDQGVKTEGADKKIVRKQALFWLGESHDSCALASLEEVLARSS